ncbi:MAG: EAL domain-containing protein [Proteobacteria bacterium]|nr:EAL domain-containing protein [Pseudomonadota bacterium]
MNEGTPAENAVVTPARVPAAAPRRFVPSRGSKVDSQARSSAGRLVQDRLFDHFLVPESWPMIAPVMALGHILAAFLRWPHHDVEAAGLAIGAVLFSLAAPLVVRFERTPGRPTALRYAAMLLGVGLPMTLYGASVAEWARASGGLLEVYGVAMLVIIGLTAGISLTSRLPTLALAQTLLWAPLAISTGNESVNLALVLGCVFGLGAAIRQTGLDRTSQAKQRDIEYKLLRAEEILADYEQTGQGWFWETDRRGLVTYISPTIAVMLGHDDDLHGRPFTEAFILEAQEQEGERTLLFHLNARSSFQDLAVRAATREEDERWWSISGRPIYDQFNNFMGFRGSGSDLTEKRRSEQHASRLAHYDSLTGLANRFQMSQTLEKILNAPHLEHRACAVFLLDLDRFKQVNDTMGHPAGDALLKQVAQRLQRTVGNLGRVGRLGGDEFEVILPGRVAESDLQTLAGQIIENLSQPYSIEGSKVLIGASVGIARSPNDGVTSEAIIRNADLALYAAKDRGRGCYHFYDSDLHSDAEERRQLEHDLRDALSHGGLQLAYQPVVHTTTEAITGFEALLRWNHPTRGWMSPGKFIPIAEDAGLIAQIGEWALRTACHDLATWPQAVRVAVNVSPLQFSNPALPAIVTSALATAGVDPDRLELEITESVFLNDDAGTDAMFTALKRVGVRLALDDFGTGYSSLGYLKKAPFDKIKIDQSFVRGATVAGSRNGAIIASIVSLAEALGMETTAEGVETLDELDLVRELSCSHVQGYIYSKPLSPEDVAELLTVDMVMEARGPRSARAARRAMLRKITLTNSGNKYEAMIRNISATGALVEGLWEVPEGTVFQVRMAEDCEVLATVRWCRNGRMGIEFHETLVFDDAGRVACALPGTVEETPKPALMRRVG